MIYLAGHAGGTGDGTAVTEREARAAARLDWLPLAPHPGATLLQQLLQQSRPPPSPFGPGLGASMAMGMGMGSPFGHVGGFSGMGGFPMMTVWEHQAYMQLQQQQVWLAQQRAAAERARWEQLP